MISSPAIDSFNEIATLRIELRDSDPLIWRVVEVPTSITLKVLHDIVQVTMGWLDYHLWEIVIAGQTYGLTMDDDWGTAPRKVASRIRLRDVLSPGTTTIDYTYDFGTAGSTSLSSATSGGVTPVAHIPASSPESATVRPKTAAAFPASTKCSKPEPTPHIPTTLKSVNGSTSTIPMRWTSCPSR